MLLKYLAVYAAILFLFLCFTVPMRQLMYKTVRGNILERNALIGNARLQDLEGRIQTLYDTAVAIQAEPSVSRLMSLTSLGPRNALHLVNAKAFVRAMKTSQEHTLASFVLFTQNNALLSDSFVEYEYSRGYGDFFACDGMDAQAWRSWLLTGRESIRLLPETGMYSAYFTAPLRRQVLTVCVSLHKFVPPDKVGVAAFVLDADEVAQKLKPDDLAEASAIVLLDADGAVLLGDLAWPLSDAEAYTVLTLQGPSLGLTAHLGLPNAYIEAQCDELLRVVQLYIAAGLLLSAVLVAFYTSRQFIPVNRLIQESTRLTNRPYQQTSEYQFIGDTLSEMSTRNDDMQRQLSLLENAHRTSLIENACLRGIYTARERAALERLLGGASGRYCIAVLRMVTEAGDAPAEGMALRAQTALLGLLPYETLPFVADQGEMVYLILLPEDAADAPAVIAGALAQTAERLSDQGRVKPYAGVSQAGTGNERMQAYYRQAKQAMLQCAGGWSSAVCVYDADRMRSLPFAVEPSDLVKLSNLILAGEAEGAARMFDLFFSRLRERPLDDTQQFVQFYFALRLVLENCAAEIDETPESLDMPPYYADIPAQAQLSQLRACALSLCEAVAARRRRRSAGRGENLLDCIAESFRDPGLSAATLAARFSLSEKYVYQYVKEQTGKPLGEIIEGHRLAFARQCLLQTDWSNERIATESGFGTPNTYYRVFRKAHGVAPGTWRAQQKKGDGA